MSYKYPLNFDKTNFYKEKELFKRLDTLYPIIDPNLYLISNYGRIWNLQANTFIPDILEKDKNVYVRVQLKDIYGNYNTHSIHKLVANVYLGIPYSTDIVIDHKDGVKWHNEPYNLEQVTSSENVKRSIELGTKPIQRGQDAPNSSLNDVQYNEICYLLQMGYTPAEIDNILDYPGQHVEEIVRNIRYNKTATHISKNYDFSKAYDGHKENKFTDQQVHQICSLLEQNFNMSTRDILRELGYNSDINIMPKNEYEKYRSVIKAIKYRKRYNNISKDYNFGR